MGSRGRDALRTKSMHMVWTSNLAVANFRQILLSVDHRPRQREAACTNDLYSVTEQRPDDRDRSDSGRPQLGDASELDATNRDDGRHRACTGDCQLFEAHDGIMVDFAGC